MCVGHADHRSGNDSSVRAGAAESESHESHRSHESHGVADMAGVECPSSLIRASGEFALGIRGTRPKVFRNGCSFTVIGSEHVVGSLLVGGLSAGILARGTGAVVAVDAATRF
ncbi:hypothetical protein GOOTI_176_00160 [Gordonia otitidis NBRC 100426]|uniref:Uncharacterized protein n=1 Tax=Gordonia otitidis (strain DSM 44809 / CCUG 52243 / JCM 12355 / NBRC 100426 / IFM 10032) TaxID=1108044 RepID=H5TQB6_GORO1|nr:hypothetical protein GOOTI_176_00160 [Gordonia otitidis NBRC 100426]